MKKIALAAIELKNINPSEVVKIAGLTRKLKNWLRGKVDPEYAASIAELRSDTNSGKLILKKMYDALNAIQDAINDGDIADYEANFLKLKEYIQEFLEKTSEIKEKVKDYYTKEEMEDPKFNNRVKEVLPVEYDVEIEKNYNKPLKEFNWYKNINISIISINSEKGAGLNFINNLIQICVESRFIKPDETDKISKNKEIIINNFKNAIINGNLIKIKPFAPSKKIKQTPLGRMELYISTAPFEVPEIEHLFQAMVLLVDLTVGQAPIKKISLKAVTHLQAIGKKTSKLNILLKKAFQNNIQTNKVNYKVTNLTELQLAGVLRKGYQQAFGADPTAEILAGGWAQVVLEAGRPIKLPNNNIGNIKADSSWINSGNPYFIKDTGEFDSKGNFYKDSGAKWKAFATPEDGAEFYWKFLQRKHPQALEWMAAKDPISATITLGLNGYFTANIRKYANGINSLYQEFMQSIAPKISNLKSIPAKINKEKPDLKDWASLYSKGEINKIFNKENEEKNDVEKLINKLIDGDEKLTKFVKKSILNQSLPKTITLTKIIGNNKQNNILIAKNISNILTKYLDSSTILFEENNNIEIQSKTLGYPLLVTAAIQNICDNINEKFKNKYNDNIIIITAPNIISTNKEMQ